MTGGNNNEPPDSATDEHVDKSVPNDGSTSGPGSRPGDESTSEPESTPDDGSTSDTTTEDGPRGETPSEAERSGHSRRGVAALAGNTVVLGVGAWIVRPAPVEDAPGWRQVGNLPVARGEMKAAAADRRLYVPGGLRGVTGGSTDRLDVYDVAADGWTTAAPMPTGLNHHGTVALDGHIYVIGGNERFDDPPGTFAFEYDPAADGWEEVSPLPDGRWGHECLAYDGRLYVLGGITDADDEIDTLVYDPGSDNWERRSPIPTRREHVAAAVVDGELVVVSGRWEGENTDAVEAYDPVDDEWRSLEPVPTARSGFGIAVLDGRLHAVGGEDPSTIGGWTTATHEVYDPESDAWESRPDAPLALHGNAVVEADGLLYVLGGAWRQGLWSVTAWSDRAFVYDPRERIPYTVSDRDLP